MIFINQLGQCELGRGKNINQAKENATKNYPELSGKDIPKYWENHHNNYTDGDVIWSDEPMEGYND